ncbi:MAG: transglycosylase SLT domain-containing protein, partial [Bacteroidota bacterium]|nr:transglycosylase SLT domain-containing protein [Bacteroidota bacterium]
IMPIDLRCIFFILALPFAVHAQQEAIKSVPADDPVMQRLDDLALLPWIKNSTFSADTAQLNVHDFPPAHIPVWTDRVYEQRLQVLDATTPFNLSYNTVVRSYIALYSDRKREMTSRMLGLSELYFPVFEEYLDRNGMPMELKYLAVVESALNPNARSRVGAVGLWQFMLPTGKMFGLHADSYIDERHDLHKSTDAACKYLKYLHNMYGNWEMALAAYNCGPGNVNKAIRRSGGAKDYWKIYDFLPRETRGYVPAFIAVNYIFEHAADHNLYPVIPTYCAYEVDTVQVCYPVDLNSLAAMTGGNASAIRELNPTFKLGIVPDISEPVSLYLPREAAIAFVDNEEEIKYAPIKAITAAPVKNEVPQPVANRSSQQKLHTVRNGESLGIIARKYGVKVSELKHWNGLRSDMIRAGQKLKVKSAPRADVGTTFKRKLRNDPQISSGVAG